MLFPQRLHDGIRAGEVTVAFRRWRRPTVVAGGTLQTPAGLLAIDEVTQIEASEITVDGARAAGHETVEAVLGSLRPGEGRTLYRIRFHRLGDDPRRALRAVDDLAADEASSPACRSPPSTARGA
jgi:hypothetical protein